MATLKYITGPDGEEYIKVDFSADLSTTGWKYSPWFYLPYDRYLAIAGESTTLTGTNQWMLRGSIDPGGTFYNTDGAQAYPATTFSYNGTTSWVFDPITPNVPTSWQPHPYMRIGFNNGSTANAADTVIFTIRFIKQG